MNIDVTSKGELPFWLAGAWQQISFGLRENRIAHALLLHGQPGLAVATLAECYAQRLLCRTAQQGEMACGHCPECSLMAAGTHPDRLRLQIPEDKQSIVIEQIRDLSLLLQQKPNRGAYRVVTIADADTMTTGAANALLKTLEEPGNDVVLILIAEKPEQLSATIRSRCARIGVVVPETERAAQWLLQQCHDMQSPADMTAARLALRLARGAPMLALEFIRNGRLPELQQLFRGIDRLLASTMDPVALAATITDTDLFLDELLRRCHQGLQDDTELPRAVWGELVESVLEARRQLQSASHLSAQAIMEGLLLRWFDLIAKFGHSKRRAS